MAPSLRGGVACCGRPRGFNAVLQPMLQIARRSATLVTITVTPSSEYAIGAPESLALAIPPHAVASHQGVRSAFDLVVMPAAGSVVLSDADSDRALYLYLDKSEADVRDLHAIDLQLELRGDTFSRDVGEDTNASRLLIEGFTSLQGGPHSWDVRAPARPPTPPRQSPAHPQACSGLAQPSRRVGPTRAPRRTSCSARCRTRRSCASTTRT